MEGEKVGGMIFLARKFHFSNVLKWLAKDNNILLIRGVISAKVLMSKQNGPIGVQD